MRLRSIIPHFAIKVRKYADGRWGFDDCSSAKRVKVRFRSKQKAEAYAIDIARMLAHGRPDLLEVIQKNGFAPVPLPRFDKGSLEKNCAAVPNGPGIYFLWEGSLVAYVGRSKNLKKRLKNHPCRLPTDKISYLCADRSELLYQEAFYIGICRPPRNGKQYQIVSKQA